MTPLERGAQALIENYPLDRDGVPLDWQEARPIVRAIIVALGEPSEEMIARGYGHMEAHGNDPRYAWESMIMAMLEEGPSQPSALPPLRNANALDRRPRLPADALAAMQNQALHLTDKLLKSENDVERSMIHQMLRKLCADLGVDAPKLNEIDRSNHQEGDILATFWRGIAHLKSKGLDFNHSRSPGKIAINLREVLDLFEKHDIHFSVDSEVRRLLRLSENPKYIGNMPINSRITLKSKSCWVFSYQ
ncbi:hypothetical protein [Sphingobium yanoikuyae]|uniref:hypothetical protein n=1 Tax=Sphingobium yanoikuyae TaxID=13690 RepID=UPI0013768621|nr:hypothetical protein [Sphingobium yanoikuyae]NBB37627.1 hypothetical protein [Sphingobium yanoikuyae]